MSRRSAQRVRVEQLASVVEGLFDEYGKEVMGGIKKSVDKTTKELVQETKATAGSREMAGRAAGTYASHITSRVETQTSTGYSKLWYVRPPEYALTHLLNNGHALRQGGRWEGNHFLSNASQVAQLRFEKRIREAIRDAGR